MALNFDTKIAHLLNRQSITGKFRRADFKRAPQIYGQTALI
jgi:hypothetical protein